MRPSRLFLGRTSYLSGSRQFRGGGGLLEEDFNYRMASKFHICLVCGNAETSNETNAGGQNLVIAQPVLSVGIVINKKSQNRYTDHRDGQSTSQNSEKPKMNNQHLQQGKNNFICASLT